MTAKAIAFALLFTLAAALVSGEPVLQQIAPTLATHLVLYTGASTALVRQTSTVRLHEGENLVTFTWTSDKLDATSVRLHAPAEVTVGETVRPAGASKSLQWALTAQADGLVPITVSYRLGGLNWTPCYRLVWEPGVTEATLRGWLTVTNDSGVDLTGVQTQLVLGRPGASTGPDGPVSFPIPDLSDLLTGASVRVVFLPEMALGTHEIYRIDSERAAQQVRMLLGVQPPTGGALGRECLPPGKMTVTLPHADAPDELLSAELRYQPGEEFEIDLGVAPDLLVERRLLQREKTNVEFDRLGRVCGFDTIERYRIEVRNLTDREADLEIVEAVPATWEFETRALYVTEKDRVIMHLRVPPGDRGAVQFTLIKHSGTRIP